MISSAQNGKDTKGGKMAQHKIGTAIFSQGWLDGQLEDLIKKATEKAAEDPTQLVIVTTMQEQWNVVSSTFDAILAENARLRRALELAKSGIELGLNG